MIPDLTLEPALDFCKELDNYEWKDENEFDFSRVRRCEPFAMLLVGLKIKEGRKQHKSVSCIASNIDNTYATTMRFYQFVGLKIGKSMNAQYGNNNYQPITKLDMLEIYNERRQSNREIGDLITERAEKMATVLASGNEEMKLLMTFCLREMLRNIREHSDSLEGWYCAQYWRYDDIVEFAIVDNGRGILKSLNSNITYAAEFMDDKSALLKALQPGVSRAFLENEDVEEFRIDPWKNSGYGLYMVSQLCAKLGGDFVIASGDTAIRVGQDINGNIIYDNYQTNVQGTAIRMRLRRNYNVNIEKIKKEIIEGAQHNNEDAYKIVSNSSLLKI